MVLHIFNPEHDIALAFGGSNFTSPRAGRLLRADLGFLPVLWAEDGDLLLVSDMAQAESMASKLPVGMPRVSFVTAADLSRGAVAGALDGVSPWGWDAAIASELQRRGVPPCLMPSEGQLSAIRDVSSRRWAALHLGNSGVACETLEELLSHASRFGRYVLKAPWSSSGRGVRYRPDWPWAEKVMAQQGAVMIEPFYEKVADFGMEFHSTSRGEVVYDGLSVFETAGGAYVGNVLASEEEKERLLCRYVSAESLMEARQNIVAKMTAAVRNIYVGPFGVDMMVCADGDGMRLVPCVELNLRRTMGHVAIALYNRLEPEARKRFHLMKVCFRDNRYYLDIQ